MRSALADGATVLIVDDTPASLGVVVEALEGAGFRVAVAEGGEEAMRRAALIQPDLILLDVMMPDLDGFAVCRGLKALAATADIPVIFMTALAEASDKLAGFSAGAVDYVTKPLQIEEVVARVSAHARLRVMQRQLATQNEELRRYREELELRVAERTTDLGASNRLLRQEVDERQRMAQALSASEQQFRTLAENSPDIIARYDRQCRRLYVSPAFERLGGIPAQGLIGKTPLEFQVNVPLVSAAFQAHIRAVLQSGAAREFDLEWYTPDGGQLSLAIRAVPEFGRDGRVASVLTIARDITERKRAEAALRESERRYRDIFNHVSDGMYMVEVTEDGRFRNLEYNPAMIRSMGIPPEQIIGKFIDEAEPRDATRATIVQLRRCMEAGTTTHEDSEIDLPSGHRYYSSSFVPLRAPGGRIYRIVAISRDVTAQKRRALLEHTRLQMLEELAAGAPLDGVLGLATAYVESTNPDFLCSIMLVDEAGEHLRSGPAPQLPADYVAAVDGIAIGEGVGSCGTAAWRNETVIAEDVRTHACWAPYKHLALAAGLLACWSEPVRDSHGRVAGTFGIYRREPGAPSAEDMETVRDASHLAALAIERKRNEAVLHRREQEIRTLVENTPDMVVRYDRECRRVYVNRAYEVISDIRREDVLGTTPLDFWRLSLPADEYMTMLRHIMATGEEETLTFDMIVAGNLHYQSMRLVPEYGQDGQVVSVLAISRDITALKRMEALLRKSEAEFRTLAENSPDMIVRYDPDCRRFYINPAYERYTGVRLEDAWNRTPHEVWTSLMPKEEYMARLQRVMKTAEPDQILLEWYLPDGSLTSHLMHTVAEYDNEGRPAGVLAIGHNISQLKATERRLEESRAELRALTARREEAREEERKRIAGEIHDELGQLLSVLRLNMTTLDFRFGNENQDLRKKLQKMVGTVDQAIAVVRSIASRLRPAVLATGTVPAVEWLVQEFTESTGIVCKLFVESDDIALDEDRSMALFRIAQESLTNVLRHSGADSVEIFLRYVDDACEMTVRDNGKGFDLARAGRHNSFGLVGMRERALMLGGEMEIVTSPGSGTTLKLRVPVGMGLQLSS